MDLSRLSQNEKLALYGAIVVLLAGIVSGWGGLLWLTVIAAAGVAVVVLLPSVSPTTSLPGSRGTLLTALGLVALAGAVVELLRWLGWTFDTLGRASTLLFLMSLAGSAVMAWAGWSELQRERAGRWLGGGSPGARPASAVADTATPAESETAPAAHRADDEARPPA